MNVARYLVQGCDVWLNTAAPHGGQRHFGHESSAQRRPKCQRAGRLVGRGLSDAFWMDDRLSEDYEDEDYQDEVESNALYDLIETDVLPLFYSRDADGLPREWIARMKETIAELTPFFNTQRMVRQYAEEMLPTQPRSLAGPAWRSPTSTGTNAVEVSGAVQVE